MKINVNINDKEALKIATRIYSSSYGMFMYGNFDLKLEELAEVIKLSLNANTDKVAQKDLDNYYQTLLRSRGE